MGFLLIETLSIAFFVWLHRRLLAELVAAKHQLRVYQRQGKKPRLMDRDRLLWVILSKVWKGWRTSLQIVQPRAVLNWQKRRVRDWWRRRSQPAPGRPPNPKEHRDLIRQLSKDNPLWGEDSIANELKAKLGAQHAPTTIRKYMMRGDGDSGGKKSQTWSTFLKNQASAIWTADFFVVNSVGLRAIYVFVVMHIESRKIVHVNTTEHPTLPWIKQQVRNACFDTDAPRFFLHDNDGKYGRLGTPRSIDRDGKSLNCRSSFAQWLWETMGIEGVAIPYAAPNAQAHIERLIGTLRRQCLDHFLIWNERHLKKVLGEMTSWYNAARVHQGSGAIPDPDPELEKPVPTGAKVVALPVLGGLHHDYRRAA